eukprot:6566331-Prymnesium_polylepis.1
MRRYGCDGLRPGMCARPEAEREVKRYRFRVSACDHGGPRQTHILGVLGTSDRCSERWCR